MRDRAVVLVALLAGTSASLYCAALPRDPGHPVAPILDQDARAVSVIAVCPDGTPRAGSGVLVTSTSVLTALHVVNCAPSPTFDVADDYLAPAFVQVSTADGRLRAATPRAIFVERDVARLGLAEPLPVAPATISPVVVGEEVCLAPARPTRTRRCGAVDATWSDSRRGANVRHGALTIPGNSGGGIYDGRGRLVALATRCGAPCTSGGLGTQLWPIREALDP